MEKIIFIFSIIFVSCGTFVSLNADELFTKKGTTYFANEREANVSSVTFDPVCTNRVYKSYGSLSEVYMWINNESKVKKGITSGETEKITHGCWIGSTNIAYFTANKNEDNNTSHTMSGNISIY